MGQPDSDSGCLLLGRMAIAENYRHSLSSYGTAKEKKIAPEQTLRGKYAKQKMNQGQKH
jgi:hypothetical protein